MDAELNEWRRRMEHWGGRCVREEPLCELYSDHDNWQLWASDVIAWLDTIDAAKARASKLETDLAKARKDRMDTMKQLANAVSGRIFADEIERLREELLRTKMELADRTRAAESVSALTGDIEKLREELAGAQVSRDLAKAALVKGDKERDLLRSALERVEWEGWLGNDECGCVCCEAPAFPRTKHDRRCAVGVALNRPECIGGES